MFQKYLSFLLLAIWRWNSDQGNSIFLSTFCGAWLNKVKVYWFFGRSIQNFHAIQGYQTFAGQWKTVTLLPVWLALFAIEVNSRDDNNLKRLVMKKKLEAQPTEPVSLTWQ
jgi:hypothetical protein